MLKICQKYQDLPDLIEKIKSMYSRDISLAGTTRVSSIGGCRREAQGSPQKSVKAYGTLHDLIIILISTSVDRSACSAVSSALSGTASVIFSPWRSKS